MKTVKYILMISVLAAFVFGLSSGSAVFASPLGSKEELSLELRQETAVEEPLTPPAPLPEEEAAPQKPDTDEAQAPESAAAPEPSPKEPATESAVPPEAPRDTEPEITAEMEAVPPPLQPQAIEAHPIIVEDKNVNELIPVEENKAVESKEVIIPAVQAAQNVKPGEKSAGVINRWFGLETGVENMKPRRAGPAGRQGSETPPAPGADGIFSLSDCISIAMKNSIQIQISEKSVKLAQMRVMEARRNMLPSVTVVFEPYTGKVNARNYVGRKEYIEGKQPIFHGGELYFTLKQAETNLEITRNEGNKIKNELTLQVKKAYYTLAKAEDNLQMQTELSGEVERISRMVKDEYDANVASKLELLNVSSQSSQAKYQFTSAEGDVAMAELILKQAMNVDPGMKVSIKPKLEFNRIIVKYDDALASALANRPEMRINLLMMEYYAYGKRIANSKSLPKLDLMGSWGLARENYTPTDNAWSNTGFIPVGTVISPEQKLQEQWYAGIKTSLPLWGSTAEYSYTREQWTPVISAFQGTEAATNSYKLKFFDNLAMYSDRQLSEIEFDRARQELNKIKQDVTLEVKEQCFNYDKALIQLDTASNKVRYQENDFEFVKLKRGLDEVQDSGVIESMIKLSQEKFGYVQALTDCHIAIASINKAIGIENYFKDE